MYFCKRDKVQEYFSISGERLRLEVLEDNGDVKETPIISSYNTKYDGSDYPTKFRFGGIKVLNG